MVHSEKDNSDVTFCNVLVDSWIPYAHGLSGYHLD